PFASTMLIHAYAHSIGLEALFAETAGGFAEPASDDAVVLVATAISIAISRRLTNQRLTNQQWHLSDKYAGPLVGWEHLPSQSRLRQRFNQIAEKADPVALLSSYFRSVTRADPGWPRILYIDDNLISGRPALLPSTGEPGGDTAANGRRVLVGFDRGGIQSALL